MIRDDDFDPARIAGCYQHLRLGDLGAHRRKIFFRASIFCRSLAKRAAADSV
ncbi:hypothetical protein KCP70_25320 [Salmonella enterica subsp. enterica]|nr:hypothetical protein KCP70_25320 [Salmonella enterica subsp. enterica]